MSFFAHKSVVTNLRRWAGRIFARIIDASLQHENIIAERPKIATIPQKHNTRICLRLVSYSLSSEFTLRFRLLLIQIMLQSTAKISTYILSNSFGFATLLLEYVEVIWISLILRSSGNASKVAGVQIFSSLWYRIKIMRSK